MLMIPRIAAVGSLVCLLTAPMAQATEIVIPHMGRLVKNSGGADQLVNGQVKLKFSIHSKSSDSNDESSLLWEQGYDSVLVDNGVYTVDLGRPQAGSAPLQLEDLLDSEHLWLETTLYENSSDQLGVRLQPRIRLAASAIAHHARNAARLGGRPAADYLLREDFQAFQEDLRLEVSTGASLTGTGLEAAPLEIAPAGVSSAHLGAGAVTTTRLADAAVTTGKLASAAVDASKIAPAAVTNAALASNAVGTLNIQDSAVSEAKVANAAITAAKLANGAVASAKLADAAVATAKLADAAVVTAKLADGAVTSAKLSDGAISTAKLANAAVTSAKIADGAISSAHIADGTIVFADIGANGCVNGQVMKRTASGWACGTDEGVTAVNAGSGITVSSSGSTRTVALDNQCYTVTLQNRNGTAWKYGRFNLPFTCEAAYHSPGYPNTAPTMFGCTLEMFTEHHSNNVAGIWKGTRSAEISINRNGHNTTRAYMEVYSYGHNNQYDIQGGNVGEILLGSHEFDTCRFTDGFYNGSAWTHSGPAASGWNNFGISVNAYTVCTLRFCQKRKDTGTYIQATYTSGPSGN